jgi:hypothetical protein
MINQNGNTRKAVQKILGLGIAYNRKTNREMTIVLHADGKDQPGVKPG